MQECKRLLQHAKKFELNQFVFLMSSGQSLSLCWSEFVIHYKLIKHVSQLSGNSFYGQYSLYLHLPTRTNVLVKEISFENEDQFKYILNQINDSATFNQCQTLCKFVKYCVKLNPQISNTLNQGPHLQKSGSILLLYENEKSLQQIIKQMITSSNSKSNANARTLSGLSPSRVPTFAELTGTNEYFSEKSLNNICGQSLKFVELLRKEEMDSIRGISLEMVQVYHSGEVDEKCRYFLYPFAENELLEMIRENRLDIEEAFVGQNILRLINWEEQQSATKRGGNKQEKMNSLVSSPTFGVNGKAKYQKQRQEQESQLIENIYVELFQSVGLLMTKLMLLAIGKDKYLQTKLYKMDLNYELAIDFDSLRSCLSQVKSLNLYSKNLISLVETLLLRPSEFNSFSSSLPIQKNLNMTNPKSLTHSNSKTKKPTDTKLPNLSKSPLRLTPSKKTSISTSKLQNRSKINLNQTLKQEKIFVNPYFDQSQSKSKPKHNSASFNLQKTSNISMPQPKKFSPNLQPKENSSNKKKSVQKSHSSSKKQILQSNLPENIVEILKTKILYDKNGTLYPNMIQKKFRDGSTYYGQYNPKLNIKEGNGLYFYFQGDVYGGTWKNDQLNGLGIYYFANGDSYQGEVINGEKEGLGVYHYANRNVYSGSWKNDKKEGQGYMVYTNGDAYEGNFVDGRKEGYGIYTWVNGDVYEGTFLKNAKHGKGIFRPVHTNTFLQCQWENDKIVEREQAQINYQDSHKVYQGSIRANGIINGQGRLNFGQNGCYQGSIKDNKFQGECLIKYQNGDVYNGRMANNLFEGYGEYYFSARQLTYTGYWHEGIQHGQGKLTHKDGTEICAQWQKGKINGSGLIKYMNRERYEGDINENGRHGEGKYWLQNGQWVSGRFQNNQLKHVYATS